MLVRAIVCFDRPVDNGTAGKYFAVKWRAPGEAEPCLIYPRRVEAAVAPNLCSWQYWLLPITDPYVKGRDGMTFGNWETVRSSLESLHDCDCRTGLVSTWEMLCQRQGECL